ncbi:MAG TPA: ABC transporter permease [Acidobacteriota bacterium]|nr:ABC transporter permease [Acidobacteriota bacterium]
MLSSLRGDLRSAFRLMAAHKGLMAVMVVVLALGIGPNLAVFAVMDAVLLKSLPYSQPDALAAVGPPLLELSPVELLDLRQRSRLARSIAGWQPVDWSLTHPGEPAVVRGARVTPNLFATLKVETVLGSGFDAEGPASAMISDRLWRSRFSGLADVLGRRLTIEGQSYPISGVMPPGFALPDDIESGQRSDVWLPIDMRAVSPRSRGFKDLLVVARLKEGVSMASFQAEITAIAQDLQREFPDWYPSDKAFQIPILRLHEKTLGRTRPALRLLLGGVGLVLLIACVNAANLLLIQARRSYSGLALRRILGASRVRLMRPLVLQSLAVALLAGVLGMAMAEGMLGLMRLLAPEGVPRFEAIQVSTRVFAFGFLLSMAVGLVFGVLPALRVSGWFKGAMPLAGRGTRGILGGLRLHRQAILAESALAMILLVGGGLMAKSFWLLTRVEAGFESRDTLTFEIALPKSRYPESHRVSSFFNALVQRLEGLPGVISGAAVRKLPLQHSVGRWESSVAGSPKGDEKILPQYQVITPGYFKTLGIRLAEGRDFRPTDDAEASAVLIVNRSLAAEAWPGVSALGKQLKMSGSSESPWLRVVGVVEDVRHAGLDVPAGPRMYLPHSQYPSSSVIGGPVRRMTVVLRVKGAADDLAGPVKQEVRRLDPGLPLQSVRSMDEVVSRSISRPRFLTSLLAAFGTTGLLLAALGVYSVVLLSTTLRRHEFGVRMAVGARPWDVLRLNAGQGLLLTLAGAGIGLLGALALTRLLSGFLFGVSPLDWSVMTACFALLTAIGLAASAIPALHSARIDPISVLRSE